MGYSAPLCALVGTLTCMPVALLRKSTREGIGWRTVCDALEEGAKNRSRWRWPAPAPASSSASSP